MCDFSYINLHFPHSGIPPHPGPETLETPRATRRRALVWWEEATIASLGVDANSIWRGPLNKGPRKNSRSKIYESEWCSAIIKRNQILGTSHQGPVWRARHLQNAFHTKGYSFLWKSGTVIIPVVWGPKLTKKGRFWKVTNCLRQPYLIHRFSLESSCFGKKKYSISKWHVDSVNYLLMAQTSCTATRDAKPLPHP